MVFRLSLSTLPQVRMLGQVSQRMGWENRVYHVGPNMLVLVREGDMSFTLRGGRFSLGRGDYLFIPKGEDYRVRSREGCRYAFIHFESGSQCEAMSEESAQQDWRSRITGFARAKERAPYSLPASQGSFVYLPQSGRLTGERENIWLMLTECDMDRYEMTPNRKLRVDLRFAQMLSLLDAHAGFAPSAAGNATLSRVLTHIHEHYMESVTLSSLAETFGLSRQYIMRLFQQHMRITVTQYITRVKLRHAAELLRYSTFRVGEVAQMLGFGSTYYFCRLFKREYALTPTEYMRAQSEEK